MTFNTLRFGIFFAVVYCLYLILRRRYKWQNILLLVAGYVFYSFWDWRLLSLIIISTFVNYYCGLKISESSDEKARRSFLLISIIFNLGLLGFFKYFNFFAHELLQFAGIFGWRIDGPTLNIILPLGISFYTFQVMSYAIDIYWGVMKPTRKIADFALFVSFFPLVISGPIERARNMLPQIAKTRTVTLDKFYEAGWLFFWGLYKKIVIADNLAKMTAGIFENTGIQPGFTLIFAMIGFTLQIYADFSGYSDMARGIARFMGFEVMVNFRVPFFAKDMYDLWQRWHISLTTWIKEYVYYPLALAKIRGRQLAAGLVVLITWAIMGFWHGPEWKFIIWGIYHGTILVIYSKMRPYLNKFLAQGSMFSRIGTAAQTILVFILFSLGLLFFAAPSASQAFSIMAGIAARFCQPFPFDINTSIITVILLAPLIIVEFFQHKKNDEMVVFKWPVITRALLYYAIFYSIVMWGDFGAQKYYYFQF